MNTKRPTEPNASPDGNIQKIAESIYRIQIPLLDDVDSLLSFVNIYLIEGSHGWLLIDTGWYSPRTQAVMETALKSLKLGFTDIGTIVVTHSHPDHFGMAGRIKHLSPKTEMLMHPWESALIESRYIKFSEPQEKMSVLLASHGVPTALLNALESAFMPAMEFVTLTLPDHILYSGEIIHTGVYDLEVIWTPGHSSGHICLYEPVNRFLFSGDHILPSISPNISYHILSGDNPLGDYFYALGKLVNLPVVQVHPGHEYPFADLKGRVNAILKHHREREREIHQIIGLRLCTSYEVATRINWEVPHKTWDQFPAMQKRLAITETIAHMEHMRWEGTLKKTITDNHILYGSN
jgi:glyoxylase-like metal-dependent hydrolase (beta-lactamase superfamily II)